MQTLREVPFSAIRPLGWIDRDGMSHFSMWRRETATIEVVATGCADMGGGPGAKAYVIEDERKALDVAREIGGIVIISIAPLYEPTPERGL